MKNIKSFFTLLFTCISIMAYSQERIVGRVLSEYNKPIAGAKVFFENDGETTLTRTNSSGNFTIIRDTISNPNLLFVEAKDYEFQTIDLNYEKENPLTIRLQQADLLDELVIVSKPKKRLKKKENPAYQLLQKVWANDYRVGKQNFDYYQYDKAEYVKIGINNLDSKVSSRLMNKSKEETLERLRGNDENHLSIPLFLSTKHQTIFGKNKNGEKEVAIVKDESNTGVIEDGFAFDRLMASMKTFDVYDNTFMVGNKPFTSPIASYGYSSYLYQLTDTIDYKNKRYFRVHFFPKYDEDLALQGDFVVRDSIFVIQSVRMYNTEKTNVNFVRDIFLEKEYEIIDDAYSIIKKDHYYTDYTAGNTEKDAMGVFLEYHIDQSDFKMNQPQAPDFYKNKKAVNEVKQNLLATMSSSTMEEELQNDKAVIEYVRDNPKVQEGISTIDMIISGYFPVSNVSFAKCFEVGSLWDLFGKSEAEGFRMRMGMRTYCSSKDRFRIYGYGAYGFRDEKFKYGVSAQYLLNREPRILVGGIYLNDNEIPAVSQDIQNLSQFRMTTKYITFFTRGRNYNITHNESFKGLIDVALEENLHIGFSAKHQTINSALPNDLNIDFEKDGIVYSTIKDFNVGIDVRYTPGRNVYGVGVEQRFGKNVFPTYAFSASKSIPNVGGSFTDFYEFRTMINYPFSVFHLGMLDVNFTAGKTIGAVPLVLTPSTAANQTYSYVPRTFSLLDTYDFVTDGYVNMFLEHHFNGFLFNKIALTRKYKLRAVIFANAAYGTISEESKNANRSNIQYHAPNNQLYWEYGFGIENIGVSNIRPFRVDAVFRNQYDDVNGPKSPMWGLRVKIFPDF